MSKQLSCPLTASDLREIAKVVDEVERKFGDDEKGLTKFGQKFFQIDLQVNRDGSDEVVGRIKYYDGWLGFYPVGMEND